MAYPVSRKRVSAPLSLAALNRAAGESCACDAQGEAERNRRSSGGTPLPLLLAPWIIAALAAALVFWR